MDAWVWLHNLYLKYQVNAKIADAHKDEMSRKHFGVLRLLGGPGVFTPPLMEGNNAVSKGGVMRLFGLMVSEENKEYLDEEQSGPRNAGVQYWFSFPNGYAGSVVKGPFTYGGDQDLWELAVMDDNTKDLCYDTPITDDVLGWLEDEEVNDYLNQIKALPAK